MLLGHCLVDLFLRDIIAAAVHRGAESADGVDGVLIAVAGGKLEDSEFHESYSISK